MVAAPINDVNYLWTSTRTTKKTGASASSRFPVVRVMLDCTIQWTQCGAHARPWTNEMCSASRRSRSARRTGCAQHAWQTSLHSWLWKTSRIMPVLYMSTMADGGDGRFLPWLQCCDFPIFLGLQSRSKRSNFNIFMHRTKSWLHLLLHCCERLVRFSRMAPI